MKPIVRRSLTVLAVLAAVALLVVLFRPQPVPVELAVAVRTPLRVTVDEEGETRIEPRYMVGAPVTGRLEAITLREGDPVRRGGAVARLHPRPLDPRTREQAEAGLRAAQASEAETRAGVGEAQAALADAERNLARVEAIEAAGVLAREQLDRARTDVEVRREVLRAARHRAEAAAFQVESARAALMAAGAADTGDAAALDVLSPVTGTVLRVLERSERVVEAGTPLLELGDPTDIEVVVDVLSTDAIAIRPGAEMLLEPGGGTLLHGRVRLVEPAGFTKVSPLGVEEQRVNVIGDFVEPEVALGDRYRVETRIVLWEGEDVLQVPTGSLFRHGDGWAVFAVEGGRARLRPVAVGHRNPSAAQVLDGLEEGDGVVLYPSDRLENGVRVSVRE